MENELIEALKRIADNTFLGILISSLGTLAIVIAILSKR